MKLKRLVGALIVIAVCVMTMPVQAAAETEESCAALEKVARAIMRARQDDTPLSRVLMLTSKNPEGRKMAIEAYKKPVWGTDKYKNKAVNEFSNSYLLKCITGAGYLG